ncbi:acyl-CoA thioesterase [Roseibacillus persicicus]|uniref:Thioesterase n=1 Tax=Roseibacillus persicicus TaxID=454148 RepID=A0A918TQI9_9BACT|nr:acyl-CoA thioesterase [Roseibacillus persicicus]GHC55462.1 hypothetical protein GCM10007100_22560 [Roseibacillus persicicus]
MAWSYRRQVTFPETDASGRVHFTSVLKWAEEAEHQFLAEKGIAVLTPEGGWPRVGVQCDYRLPFAFGDEFEVELVLAQMGRKSLRWSFRILNVSSDVAAEGEMTTVFVEQGEATEIPQAVRALLDE